MIGKEVPGSKHRKRAAGILRYFSPNLDVHCQRKLLKTSARYGPVPAVFGGMLNYIWQRPAAFEVDCYCN